MTTTMIFENIEEGMDVCDPNEDKIGVVEYVKFADGGSEADLPEVDAIMATLDEVLSMNTRHPEEVYERLYLNGFLRVERGLEPDKYVLPQQIDRVADGCVYLNVNEEDLLDE